MRIHMMAMRKREQGFRRCNVLKCYIALYRMIVTSYHKYDLKKKCCTINTYIAQNAYRHHPRLFYVQRIPLANQIYFIFMRCWNLIRIRFAWIYQNNVILWQRDEVNMNTSIVIRAMPMVYSSLLSRSSSKSGESWRMPKKSNSHIIKTICLCFFPFLFVANEFVLFILFSLLHMILKLVCKNFSFIRFTFSISIPSIANDVIL